MDNLAAWSRFVARRVKAPPLTYLSGIRHIVKRGVCCQMHSHQAIEIVYHPRGKGITRLKDGRHVAFDEGSIVVYAPGERHDQVMHREGEDLCVTLAVLARHGGVPRQCFCVPRVDDTSITEDIRILSQGRVGLDKAEQAIFNLRATSTLYALVRLVCSRRAEDDVSSTRKHVLKVEQYLRDHFSTIKTLREVAAHIGISYDHLRHEFKDQCGKSPVRYLNEVRMERAKTLLVHSRLPLKQVATMCGFADEYYFSAVFRTFAGMPPGRYRAKLS